MNNAHNISSSFSESNDCQFKYTAIWEDIQNFLKQNVVTGDYSRGLVNRKVYSNCFQGQDIINTLVRFLKIRDNILQNDEEKQRKLRQKAKKLANHIYDKEIIFPVCKDNHVEKFEVSMLYRFEQTKFEETTNSF